MTVRTLALAQHTKQIKQCVACGTHFSTTQRTRTACHQCAGWHHWIIGLALARNEWRMRT